VGRSEAKASGGGEGRRRSGYPEPLEAYAERYGAGLRTVKRWAAIGRERNDRTPLDRAVEMPGWWARNMQLRCPAEVLAAAGAVTVAGAKPAGPEFPEPVDLPPLTADDLTTEATLRRLAEGEARMGRLVLSSSGSDMLSLAKPWTDTAQRLTITLKAYREEAEKMGRLVDRGAVDQALRELHAPVVRMVRRLYRTWCRVTGLPATNDGEEKWQADVDRELEALQRELAV